MSLEFPRHAECKDCPLWQFAYYPGVPTRASDFTPAGRDLAVLAIGEAPGFNEDSEGKSWVGYAGHLLHLFFSEVRLPEIADIYLANACRCRPPQNSTPTDTQVRICRGHLLADLRVLLGAYKRVAVLCVGATAARMVGRKSLKEAFHFQGRPITLFPGITLPVFYTTHTAALAPSRDPSQKRKGGPSLADSIGDQLTTMVAILSGRQALDPAIHYVRAPDLPPVPFPEICLDIETYGIIRGQNQTVFHPVKSQVVDRVFPPHQVVAVGIGYPDGDDFTAGIFLWGSPRDRRLLAQWLMQASAGGTTLLGSNIVFDLMYLRRNSSLLKRWLAIDKMRVDDILILNHLQYELRPERGLKPLSELLGVASYGSGGFEQFPSARSPALHRYLAKDCIAPLRLKRILLDRIAGIYGPGSPKLSQVCTDFRHQMIWSVLRMSEAGTFLDAKAIEAIQHDHLLRLAEQQTAAEERGLVLSGRGSDTSKREAVAEALGDTLIHDPSVEFTEKKREVSFGKANILFLLQKLPPDHPSRPVVQLIKDYADSAYIVSHYTRPLLTNPRVGITANGIAYPSWYLVPMVTSDERDSDEKEGGTIQGRITCAKPPEQTFPPAIKAAAFASRFYRGVLLIADLSQIELRVAALLSNDPVLMSAYTEGRDLHGERAVELFPSVPPDSPQWKDVYRQAAKHSNFAMLYLASGARLHTTLLEKVGHRIDVPLLFPVEECERIVRVNRERYHVYYDWITRCVEDAAARGYVELLTGWGRTFVGSRADVEMTYAKEIANCRIQTLAAQLLLSGQFALQQSLDRGFRSVISLNVYDALHVDTPADETTAVESLLGTALTRPPLLATIEQSLGRTVPITYEVRRVAGSPTGGNG